LGGNGDNTFNDLKPFIPKDGNLILVCPDGPYSTGYGDGRAWYKQVHDDVVSLSMLWHSIVLLDQFLVNLPTTLGCEIKSIELAGFSQGGTVALSYALARPGTAKHTFCFSGYLPQGHMIRDPKIHKDFGTIYWMHGTEDRENPYYLATRGMETLKTLGLSAYHFHAPVGHTMTREWVEALFPEEDLVVGDA